jgi:hypothetical protein
MKKTTRKTTIQHHPHHHHDDDEKTMLSAGDALAIGTAPSGPIVGLLGNMIVQTCTIVILRWSVGFEEQRSILPVSS